MESNGLSHGYGDTGRQKDTERPDENQRARARESGYRPAYEQPSRRPASQREASFNKLAWLVDGVTGAMEEVLHSDLGLSEDFWTHLYAARQEGLLALQALVDDLVEKAGAEPGKPTEPAAPPKQQRGGIDIDF